MWESLGDLISVVSGLLRRGYDAIRGSDEAASAAANQIERMHARRAKHPMALSGGAEGETEQPERESRVLGHNGDEQGKTQTRDGRDQQGS